MVRSAINKITAAVLLAYFVLFIVPPVSSFASETKKSESAGSALVASPCADPQQGVRFLFDIIVWQQFKKTKQSEFLTPIDNIGKFFTNAEQHLQPAFVSFEAVSHRIVEMCRFFVPPFKHRSSVVCYSRSGNSPPFRLS